MDTTATQALIDARTEIEAWANHQVEVCLFVFAFEVPS